MDSGRGLSLLAAVAAELEAGIGCSSFGLAVEQRDAECLRSFHLADRSTSDFRSWLETEAADWAWAKALRSLYLI